VFRRCGVKMEVGPRVAKAKERKEKDRPSPAGREAGIN
jgi:hypothetical protein